MKVWLLTKKRALELILYVLPVVYVGFVIGDRAGLWDRLRGLDEVERVAARLETSYATNVVRQIKPEDKAWRPLLSLIQRYTCGFRPILIARSDRS